ncbi:MAG: hypothetical protein A2161_01935 [Candidatus Schekmanbacteria bacterium RBG_13_48_7]|uniref:Zinc-finger domain-containing protein n=1 Tax=Candidatus Schekmanbacteria bacterium RBG_13_48_7 TaxID=1817878 RepID=A0A1F7S0M7_9BACT|nr:MAG: hypothetical protein A2161_01935 [Candidatus Schekmanbacteria bacterium RBG_13_48_7]
MKSCKESIKLISESMDEKLPILQFILLRFHLLMCDLCSQYKKQMMFIRNTVQFYIRMTESSDIISHQLSQAARERIINTLKNQ